MSSFICDEKIVKLFPLKNITDVVQLFKSHLESAREPDLTLLSIVTGIIENKLTRKCQTSGQVNASGTVTAAATVTNAAAAATAAAATAVVSGNDVSSTTESLTSSDDVESPGTPTTPSSVNNFPVVQFETVQELYDKFIKVISMVGEYKPVGVAPTPTTTTTGRNNARNANANGTDHGPVYATREIIKHCSDVIWNSLIRSTYKDRAHLQSLYSYLAENKLDCFGVALAVVAGCQLLGYADVHLAISEDHAWVVFGKTGEETIEVTWHGKGAEDKRGQSVMQGYESHSWLYLSGQPVVCDRYMEIAAIVSSINPSLSMTSACLEVAELQQQLLWLLYDMKHLQRYPMSLGCLGELEEVAATAQRPSCADLYRAAVESAQTYYRNHHVYPYTYQGGYHYRRQQYKEAFESWANAGDVIRLYNYSRDDEEIYKEFLDIANELIPHVMKTESSGHSAKSVLRDPQCFANLLRFYDGICLWEEGSQTPILHIGWAKPLVTTISRFDGDIRSQVIIHCARDNADMNNVYASIRQESNNNEIDGCVKKEAAKIKCDDSKIDSEQKTAETVRTTLVEALTAACGEKILNPDFLLQGDGQPFADQQQTNNSKKSDDDDANDEKMLLVAHAQQQVKEASQHDDAKDAKLKSEISVAIEANKNAECEIKDEKLLRGEASPPLPSPSSTGPVFNESLAEDVVIPKRPEITLYSQKMKGLKDLLLGEKLNTHAISLQLTAQSQVQIGGKKSRHSLGGAINYASSTKRSRRE